MEPTTIDKTPEKPKKADKKKPKSDKIKKHNFKINPNKIIFGAEANNNVTGKIEPS
jgi:hypothetical protein